MSSSNLEKLSTIRNDVESKSFIDMRKKIEELLLLRKTLENQMSNITYELNRALVNYSEVTGNNIHNNEWAIKVDRDSHWAVEIVDDVIIPVERVANAEQIPDVPMYYMEDTDQFGIRVAGTLHMGNIGQIFNGHDKNKTKIRALDNRAHNVEKFYMNPAEYANRSNIRNFSDSSWVYCPHPRTQKNVGMRHIGSRDRLREDLKFIPNDEKQRFRDQVIHDLLISICMKYN